MHRPWRRALLIAALAVIYFAAGKFGLAFFGALHPSASPVWLPSGIALAAVLRYGAGIWPGVLAGAFLVNLTTEGSIATSLGVAAGNTLEALLAAYLVGRFAGGRYAFVRATDILKFGALAGLLSTAVGATIGVGSLALGGYVQLDQLAIVWFTWWLGDAAGVMLVTPLLLLWHQEHALRFSRARAIEALLLLAAVTVTGVLVFVDPLLEGYPLGFLCIPALVWAAFRFGRREVATAVGILSAMAIAATVAERGPFVMQTPNESLLLLQAFMALLAMTALPMAALNEERAALLERERAARGQAEAASRAKDEFLAVLSHELRNPLSAIAAAEALLGGPGQGTTEAQRWREIIRRQTFHLTRMIDDLLDTARITVGKMSLARKPLELGAVATRCAAMLAAAADGAVPEVEVEASGEAWIEGDADRIEQIIDNLLTNAVKHTPPAGRVRVDVGVDGADAVLRVADTGAGIGAELLPRIFDPFVQGEQGPERAGGGLGVGLTLVRRLTELHGGRVDAESEGRGRGSLFIVRLPSIVPPTARAPGRSAARPARPPHETRVLLVEDNADTREALRTLLAVSGYDVHCAADGVAGLAAAGSLQPDIVLLDIGLPKLDGYEVARRLRGIAPHARVVALTGYGREEDKARTRAAGFDAHLVKPVSIERLRGVIDELLVDPPRRGDCAARRPPDVA